MAVAFQPNLVNPPLKDPGLFIRFAHERRALLFDMGDLTALAPRDILKISHVFVSHTHVDHFYGFDRLLRLTVERPTQVHLFGPAGFMAHVQGKLDGYLWNLLGSESQSVTIDLTEVTTQEMYTRRYRCRKGFKPEADAHREPLTGQLLIEPNFTISVDILDHGTPCLAFALQERYRINVLNEGLRALGLYPGPWLKDLKMALYTEAIADREFVIPRDFAEGRRHFVLSDLAKRITRTAKGQKIAYITDIAYSDNNISRVVRLASEADHLFIEAAFLERHHRLASARRHLTARQAGKLAAMAGVKRVTPFHYSARYSDKPKLIENECRAAFERHRRHMRHVH